MSYVQVCPQLPDSNGLCPVALEWVETASAGITLEQWHSLLPVVFSVLLSAWGVKTLVRFIKNR